jgi:UDP-N-acetyl-2-amino-2-deoxyglucuronate dehydrogenase
MSPLRYGLIGCGEIAVQTSKAILSSQASCVVHCMDVRGDLAADLAAKHGAKATADLDNLLRDDQVQAVIVSTPHHLHAPLAVKAAQAGKHVISEKPMATTLDEADAMIAAAERAGVKLGVLLPLRLNYQAVKAGELVRGGAIGRVLAYQFHAMAAKPESYWHGGYTGRAKDDWRISLDTSGGGILIMNMVHNLDTFVSILDPSPKRVYAEYSTLATKVQVEDYLSLVMRLSDGAVVSLDASSAAPGRESFGDRIYGEKGQIDLGKGVLRVYVSQPQGDLKPGQWNEIPAPADYPSDTRLAYVDGFSRAVLEGGDPPVSGHEGRRSLEIIRGAYLSMKRGRPVEFPVSE